MKHARWLTLILGTAVVVPPAAAQRPAERLALARYLDWETVADPQLSPDGQQIVYTRRWVDRINDDWVSAIWAMNADGTNNRFLVDGSSPQWSPDGKRIAFSAPGKPAGTQIFVRGMDAEGAVTQVTRTEHAPRAIQWSPDGKWIAFNMLVPTAQPSGANWRIDLPRPEAARWTPDPYITERYPYRQDRVGYLEEGSTHVFVVPADGGTARQLTDGEWEHGAPRWAPDSRTIVFQALRYEIPHERWREQEVYAVDLQSRAIRQLTTRPGPDQNPVLSPDGRLIAYTGHDQSDDSYTAAKLYVMNASDGGNPRVLTAQVDRQPERLMWAADGSGVYFTAQTEGSSQLFFAPLRGEVRQLTKGPQMLAVSSMHPSGRAVGTLSTASKPEDIVTFDVKTPADVRQLTTVNDDVLRGVQLGEVEELWYPSVDGWRIQGWIVKPPDFTPSRKYPMILPIHGGPHSMYDVGFDFAFQEHAANGYVVVYLNPRGSTGYGSAFGNGIEHAYPDKDFLDLMAGVDTVVARGYVDEKNLFVYGCSGGGHLTAWTVGHTKRFAAAASMCPVIDWLSFTGTVDHVTRASIRGNFAKWPWEDPSEHLKRSPVMHAGNVTTPTLMMGGVKDMTTPLSQAEEFYAALKIRGVPAAMIRVNEEWHGTTSKPSNFLRTQLYLRKWFERWGTVQNVRASGAKP